jgi:hypothetical protein
MDFTGKPMKSMVYVDAEGTSCTASLQQWIATAAAAARQIPPKKSSARSTNRAASRRP